MSVVPDHSMQAIWISNDLKNVYFKINQLFKNLILTLLRLDKLGISDS